MNESDRKDVERELTNILAESGAFPYEEWSDDAGGSYSLDGLASLIVEWFVGEGFLSFHKTTDEHTESVE